MSISLMALYGVVNCVNISTHGIALYNVAIPAKISPTTSWPAATAAQVRGALAWPATQGGTTGLRRRMGTSL